MGKNAWRDTLLQGVVSFCATGLYFVGNGTSFNSGENMNVTNSTVQSNVGIGVLVGSGQNVNVNITGTSLDVNGSWAVQNGIAAQSNLVSLTNVYIFQHDHWIQNFGDFAITGPFFTDGANSGTLGYLVDNESVTFQTFGGVYANSGSGVIFNPSGQSSIALGGLYSGFGIGATLAGFFDRFGNLTAQSIFAQVGVNIAGSGSGTSVILAPATGGGTATLPMGSGTLCYVAACSGAGGAFASLVGGTYSTAAFVVGTGASMSPSGSGTITATGLTGNPAIGVNSVTIPGCTGQFTKADGTGCAPAPGSGNTVFTSQNSNSLGTAIAAAGTGGYVYVDAPITLANSSLSINTSNLTIACQSPLVPVTFSASSRLLLANGADAKNVTIQGCKFVGPDFASGSAPIVAGNNGNADGFKMIGNSLDGFGTTSGNGTVEIINASHVEIGSNRAGTVATGSSCTVSTASWAAPVSGTMFGLETITFSAAGSCASAFPADFAGNNALYCTGMSPVIFNHPGDGQTMAFGQIMSVAYPSLTVQQIYNPGTYVSGGTCQAGIGNKEADFTFNVVGSNSQVGDWNIHDNDISAMTLHQATVGSVVSGVRITGNLTHPGFNNNYYWGIELGSFGGVTGAMANAFTNVAEANNVCKMAADTGGGSNLGGCYSQGNSTNVTETGNQCYSGGHVYTIQCDENAGAQILSSTGGIYNGMGGGSIEDINRMNRGTISGEVLMYPAPTGQFISGGAASGGVGAQAPATSSYNTITGNTLVDRVEICPPANSAWANNTCGGQITSCIGTAGTVACSFTPGTFMPWLANGQTFVIAGNQTTAPCGASTVNALQTVTAVSGGGTGFSFSNASINGLTCTGGKATGDGIISTAGAGTTAYALFQSGPTPFKVGDTTLIISGTSSSGGSFNAQAQTVTGVGQGPAPYWVSWVSSAGSGLGGNGFAGNHTGKFISFQNNIAAGSVVDGNVFTGNNFVGNGSTSATNQAFSFSNNASSSGSMDRTQITGNRISDLGEAFNMNGTGSLAPTNTKIELGSMTNVTALAGWGNGATISDDSSNPQSLGGALTGVCSSSVTEFLYTLGQNATTVCNNAGAQTENQWVIAKHAGTVQGLFCTSTANGVSGVVTVRNNSTNKTVTCSLAGVQSCNDTAHSFTVAQGDLLDIQIAMGAVETLANPKCKYYVWYQDN